MNRPGPGRWGDGVAESVHAETTPSLIAAVEAAAKLGVDERKKLISQALQVAERRGDQVLLTAILRLSDAAGPRADVLAAVLGVVDELSPGFSELMAALRDGERILVLGTLIESSRLDPDPERRLLRLKRLVQAAPQDSRGLYWVEAEALAERGGDDAQLTLLGFVHHLPSPVRPLTLAALRRAVRKVDDAFKRAMAFVSLSEMSRLDGDDLREAMESAMLVPDDALRTATMERLSKLDDPRPG